MFRLNVRVSEGEYRMLRDLRLALYLESDSAVIRHLITEGYASELAAIEDAKRRKAARDERQLKIPFRGDPNETTPVTRLVSEETVVEGEPTPSVVELPPVELEPAPEGKRRASYHESRAALARKKKKQAKERGHKSRGLQIPKPKRGAP